MVMKHIIVFLISLVFTISPFYIVHLYTHCSGTPACESFSRERAEYIGKCRQVQDF